ncbi:MAG: hypothetical protein UT32_C0032G0004 [Parcubacteria group bacterium GW2011_GWC2_39_14]|nr:MAG: hypothetical protein UT32_C0032G0004 [Parcubacteria group bacterium GW2011_GWC2_39_14]KKR53228.1 MAG: hypothetical protein UT91_C0031G0004 [Parcubacteria group bacterium GW2011_GWA2_40_23]
METIMGKFIWEMCLELDILFGQDIVLLCSPELDDHKRFQVGFKVQLITQPSYTRLSWVDDNIARRPSALVSAALRQSPQARLFLLDQRGQSIPADSGYTQQKGVLAKLFENSEVRRLILQEPRTRLCIGTIHCNELTLAPPEDVDNMLRELTT